MSKYRAVLLLEVDEYDMQDEGGIKRVMLDHFHTHVSDRCGFMDVLNLESLEEITP